MLAHGPIYIRAKGCLPLRGSALALASDPARHVRAYARPAVCTCAWRFRRATSLSVPSHAPALRAPGRRRVRMPRTRSRVCPYGRARHLCAPIRDAGARACLPVRAWSLKGRSSHAGVCVRAPGHEGARLRTRVPHACAQSCSRPRAHRPMRSRAGARRTPVRGRPIACKGLRGMRASVRELAREAGVPDRAAAEFRAPRANSCPAYGRGGPIRRAAPQVSPHAPVWGVGLFAYLIGVRHRLGVGARPCVRRWAGCGSRASCMRAHRAVSG